jgi:signal peptidase I
MVPHDRVQLPGQPFPHVAPPNGEPSGRPASAQVQPSVKPKPKDETPAVKDAFREVVETVVFVIVLVLLLKTFVAEAFVIPTGSMAETLLGYQKWETCPQCGYTFPVNCSSEVDPQQGPPVEVVACTCPNCRFRDAWKERDPINNQWRVHRDPPAWGSGDRVLVSKFPFDNGHFGDTGRPNRFDVVVFKFPVEPQKGQIPMNYIKRLCGLPGETIGIKDGDLYVCETVDYPPATHRRPDDPKELWRLEHTYSDDEAAVRAFKAGEFQMLRKTPDLIDAMKRIVFDNDHQAQDLIAKNVKPRWQDRGGWAANDPASPKVFRQNGGSGEQPQWLRYQHLIYARSNTQPLGAPPEAQPDVIRNYMGYNTGELADGRSRSADTHWVGDLILDCSVTVEALQGDLILELSKGADRFQARFDLRAGSVALWRVTGGQAQELAKAEKAITKTGTFKLRFSNVDCRLTVSVDGGLPFQDKAGDRDDRKAGGVDYPPPTVTDSDHPNNKEPASVGAGRGAKLSVAHLSLWRDTYYTPYTENRPGDVRTLYVQPGHFLCLGDNSSESSDSRYWGLVPQRLLLGRALVVYYPFTRAGLIR